MKCTICDKEFNNLSVHMMKKHKTINVNKKDAEKWVGSEGTDSPDPRYATKEDLNRINSSLDKLTDLLTVKKSFAEPAFAIEQQVNKTVVEKNPEESDKSPVPPKWRQTVDEILGTDFGINVVYPDQGNGFLFKIIVPLDKSNAAQSHLDYYKSDIRTKSLSYSDGIDGVKRYCELVKRNLQKNNNKPL